MKLPSVHSICALLLVALLSACGEKSGSITAAVKDRDADFARVLASLNLEDPSYKLSYKDSGTSLGLKIKRGEEKIGKWLPKNEAADPEAQVVSYYLGRALGMDELVIPAGYYTAGPRALGEFHAMLRNAQERNQLRSRNQQTLLAALARNSSSMEGVFTMPVDSFELATLIETDSDHRLGTLRQDQPIARLLHADGPLPSTAREMDLGSRKRINGVAPVNNELVLARELSKIFVLDVLCGQFDRFSGGNLEGTVDAAGKLHFIARDNGGAGLVPGSGSTGQYFELFSRFDRAQIELVRKLDSELASDTAGVASAMHIRSNPRTFVGRVNSLLEHVDRQRAKYSDARVFFPE